MGWPVSGTPSIRVLGVLGHFCAAIALFVSFSVRLQAADTGPTLLVNVDHRTSISLDGDWHFIVDPYDNGYYDFRMQPRADGYFRNEKPDASGRLIEYDFSKSATL